MSCGGRWRRCFERQAVYQEGSGYAGSTANLARITLATDNVFADDQAASQMATLTGSVSEGYVATLTIGIAG